MSSENIKKKGIQFLIHLGFILAFLVVDLAYFSSTYSDDYHLKMHDVKMGKAAAQEAKDFREATGEEPLWTGTMFSGMPLYIVSVRNEGNLVKPFHHALRFLGAPGDVIFLAFLCFYILMVSLKSPPVLAFMGGASYALTTFGVVSVGAGHVFKLLAMAYMPLVLAGFLLIYKRKYISGAVLFLLGLGLELDSQHPQITYYLFFVLVLVGLYFLVETIKNSDWKRFGISTAIVLVIGGIAILPNVPMLWQSMEYNKYSTRGGTELTIAPPGQDGESEKVESTSGLSKEYVFDYSSGVFESFTMVVPNLYGGASGLEYGDNAAAYNLLRNNRRIVEDKEFPNHNIKLPSYWGPQERGTAGPIYAGTIIFFLFVLGLVVIKSDLKWYILGAYVLFVMLSWGKNFSSFNYFMFDYFPLYNKFRAVSMAAVGATFCLPLLATLAVKEILQAENKVVMLDKLKIAGYVMIGILVLILGFALTADFSTVRDGEPGPWLAALKSDRQSLLYFDIFRSFALIGMAFAGLWIYLKGGLHKIYLMSGLAALSLLDIYTVDKRYLNETSFTEYIDPDMAELKKDKPLFKPSKSNVYIMKDKALSYRVFDQQNPFNNATTSYFHKSLGGYHGAKLRRYQDLIEWYLSKGNAQVLDMLNTKYLIAYYQVPGRNGQQVLVDTAIFRPSNLGNAWFVEEIKSVESANDEITSLGTTNLRTTAVVDVKKFPQKNAKFGANDGKIELTKYSPKHLVYSSSSTKDGYAVFSEIYYPIGWNATIDGKAVEYDRVNYVLRGMNVPAGDHKIEFKFEPKSFTTGNSIAMIGSVLFYLIVFGGLGFLGWKEFKESQVQTSEANNDDQEETE